MKSYVYYEDMNSCYNGRWTIAHRCSMHSFKLTEEDSDKAKVSYEKGEHTKPTGCETQTFSDLVIHNADLGLIFDREVPESAYCSDLDFSS